MDKHVKNIIFPLIFITVAALTAAVYSFLAEEEKGMKFAAQNLTSAVAQITQKNKIAEDKKNETYINLLFVGDIMLDRGIKYYADKNGGYDFIFEKVADTLKQNDLVIANLEGPITDNKSVSYGTKRATPKNYIFTFDPIVTRHLFENKIRLVSLGNNHTLNFGEKGLESTKKYLDDEKISYFGAPGGENNIIKKISKTKIAFINYNQFAGDLATDVTNKIKKLKTEVDFIFVYSHWGNEYEITPSNAQKKLAHQFIDAGADLVIGSHPHVIQTIEEYKGKRIYYSLGNFIFDQHFEEQVRNGLGVSLRINETTKKIEFKDQNFYLATGGQTILK